MEDDWDESLFRKPEYRGLRGYHLKSALVTGALNDTSFPAWDKRKRAELSSFQNIYALEDRDPSSILGILFTTCPFKSVKAKELDLLGKSLEVESRMYPGFDASMLFQASLDLSSKEFQSKYWDLSNFLNKCVVISNALNAKRPLPQDIVLSDYDQAMGKVALEVPGASELEFILGDELFQVRQYNGELAACYEIDHLRNWSDKITERMNVEIATFIGHKLDKISYPSAYWLYELWDIIDQELILYGNKTYSLCKVFESLCIGVLLDLNPNSVISSPIDFLQTTLADFKASSKSDLGLCQAADKLICHLRNADNDNWITQAYGLYRSWGHPVVDVPKGMDKVMTLGMKQKGVSETVAIQASRVFKCKYLCWYKDNKGEFPEVRSHTGFEESSVYKAITGNVSTAELRSLLINPGWDTIDLCKTIDIPTTYNLAEMVADKAVSPDRDSLFDLSCKLGRPYDATQRRGVLQWLIRDPESCSDFLKRVATSGLSENELIIGLYPKERELNTTPRMFALMSYAIRNYVVTTEQMISTDLLSAFPQVTMTNSLLDLQKRILSVTKAQSSKHGRQSEIYKDITEVVNIDFEKWNLNMRRITTFFVFLAMGQLYGLCNLFNVTYDIFEKAYIYLANGNYKPLVDRRQGTFVLEPPYSYLGHIGGFEGLRQKGWTIFTVCVLEMICSRHRCRYQILGQGDNQVLVLTFRTYSLLPSGEVSEKGLRTLNKQFLKLYHDLVNTFGDVGLPIKALETWTSETLFLYGKFPTMRGVPLVMSLKKICRAYHLANKEIMTLDCALATIASNALAACMADISPWVSYVVYKIQQILAILAYSDYHVLLGAPAFDTSTQHSWKFTTAAGSRFEFSLTNPLSKAEFVLFLGWFPKVLGGVNVLTWVDFTMRGFSDPVSAALTGLLAIISQIREGRLKDALWAVYAGHINPEKSWVLLVEDPSALNLVVPVDATSSVKQSVQELFENLQGVRNQEFAEIFQFNKLWDQARFCETLCEGEILHPRFLHDIAAATVTGYIDSVVSKVSSSTTINKIALRSSGRNPGRRIQMDEKNFMMYLLWKPTSGKFCTGLRNSCPTEQARSLRYRSWGKVLEGVTVPHPMAFLCLSQCTDSRSSLMSCDRNYISVYLSEDLVYGQDSSLHVLGNSPPYLGSVTKEKLGADPVRQVYGKEPLIKRPLSLLRVINWFVDPGSNAEEVLFSLITAVSDLTPANYVSREMGITGSESHRYKDQALKHGVMATCLYLLGTKLHVSTDSWIKYTRGSANYTINYQAILCFCQCLVGGIAYWKLSRGMIPNRSYHFHESCNLCIEPLSEIFHDFPSKALIPLVPSDPSNQYLWVKETTLEERYKRDRVRELECTEFTKQEYDNISFKRGILINWVANRIIRDIQSTGSDTFVHTGLYDVKEYPRVMYKKLGAKELWEEVCALLVLSAGVRYNAKGGSRVVNIDSAFDLACDDLMKCPVISLMGASLFYTWPEKFAEISSEVDSSIFPDQSPPTMEGICRATRTNLRDLLMLNKMSYKETRARNLLVLPRDCRDSDTRIREFWYSRKTQRQFQCPHCIRAITTAEILCPISAMLELKCGLDHVCLKPADLAIVVLSASDDRLLKDCLPYEPYPHQLFRGLEAPKSERHSSAVCIIDSLHERDRILREGTDIPLIQKYPAYADYVPERCFKLPTSTWYRVLELQDWMKDNQITLSGNVWILGDGLGLTSNLLSALYPQTKFTVSAYYDSGSAIPQTFEHTLMGQNPVPSVNCDYITSRSKFNDIRSPLFEVEWRDWITADQCYCDIEVAEFPYQRVLENLLRVKDWDMVIIRSEFKTLEDRCNVLRYLPSKFEYFQIILSGSLKFQEGEVYILGRHSGTYPVYSPDNVIAHQLISWNEGIEQVAAMIDSPKYLEYLLALETPTIRRLAIKRVDSWFSEVGLTHLLLCKTHFTPLWWDLQTGKIPESVQHMRYKKEYYMYQSDFIALQARLIALALSMIRDTKILRHELSVYTFWDMSISPSSSGKTEISLNRAALSVDYGSDGNKIPQLIPSLRALNSMSNRWFDSISDSIRFTPGRTEEVAFRITKGSMRKPIPSRLVSQKYDL